VKVDNYEFYFNPAIPLRWSILMGSLPLDTRYNFYCRIRPIITNGRQLTVRRSYGGA